MRSDPSPTGTLSPQKPLRLLLWAAVLSLLFGALQIGQPLEDVLRVARNSLHMSKASGDIVFVEIDDASLREIGEWPWPRSVQARMIDEATRVGADRVFLDLIYDNPTTLQEDHAFASALKRSGRVVLPVRRRIGPTDRYNWVESMPLPAFRPHTGLASITGDYNYQHAMWQLPFSAKVAGRTYPSFATLLAARPLTAGKFRLDYSIDVNTVPRLRAVELLKGRVNSQRLQGKTVVIGQSADQLADQYWIPGKGRLSGSYVHIIGAETLKRDTPVDLGWLATLLVSLLSSALALLRLPTNRRGLLLGFIAAALLTVPLFLEQQLIFIDVVPSLLAVGTIAGRLGWHRWKQRGLTNSLSGLPNLDALRARGRETGGLIAARLHNYAEIASALSDLEEQELVRQIADRLRVTRQSQEIYQGDEGIFAWTINAGTAIGNHLEALHALFRSPIAAGGRPVDIAISFGAEMGSERSLPNRLGSALVAADEAWSEGLRWKLHDPAREEEIGWRLSLLSRLDAAIDSGEVWLAYQPQFDLRTGEIVGAEALARWTHPEKGPISPSEFIAAAEANGRISKLTDFVLDRAISTAAAINRRNGTRFSIAVNLSARLLADSQIVNRVQRMLAIHGLPADQLTLELTETAAITETDNAIALLDRLKSLGARIAIDDYGTGLSTLDYLKKIPADEIKIDQSFVRSIRVNRSDLIMVQSTIALAHSLGRKVVAEGVEDQQVLEELHKLNCDLVQGYVIGRPMGVRELIARLAVRHDKRVA